MSIKSMTTTILMTIPFVIGFLVILVWEKYAHTHYDGAIPKSTNDLIVGLTFLTWSLSFVVVIIRKEFPSPITLRGIPAIIVGSIFLLASLYFGIGLVLRSFGVF